MNAAYQKIRQAYGMFLTHMVREDPEEVDRAWDAALALHSQPFDGRIDA